MSRNSKNHLTHLQSNKTTKTRKSLFIERVLRVHFPTIVKEIQYLTQSRDLTQSRATRDRKLSMLLRLLSHEFRRLPDEELARCLRKNEYFQFVVLRAITQNDNLLNQVIALLSADGYLSSTGRESVKAKAFSRIESLSNYNVKRPSKPSSWHAREVGPIGQNRQNYEVVTNNTVMPQDSDKALSINQHAARFLKDLTSHNKLVAGEYTDKKYINAPLDSRLSIDIYSVEQAVKETRALIEQSIQKAPS